MQATGKRFSLFNKPMRSPASFNDVTALEALQSSVDSLDITSPRATLDAGHRQIARQSLSSIPETGG